MKRRELAFLFFSIFVAAIFGAVTGDVVSGVLPDGAAKTLLGKHIEVGFDATKVDLYALSFTVGFLVRINFMSILLVIFVLVYFRWWYI